MSSIQPADAHTTTTPTVATKPTLKQKLTDFAHKLSPKHVFHKDKAPTDSLDATTKSEPHHVAKKTAAAPAPEAPVTHATLQ